MDIKSMLNDREVPRQQPALPSVHREQDQQTSYQMHDSPQQMHKHEWHSHSGECTTDNCSYRPVTSSYRHEREDSLAMSPRRPSAHAYMENDVLPKSLPCYQCHKLFTRRSDLVRHERIHSGVRPHACTYPDCGKSFIQRSALTIHERVHTGDKPHECKQCGKPFSDSSSLARHRRTHTGVRPYRCDFQGCGKDFTRKTTLSRHRQQHSTKGHVPVTGMARRSPSKQPSNSTLSSYADNAYRHEAVSNVSPVLPSQHKTMHHPTSMYYTFQVGAQSDLRSTSRLQAPPPPMRTHSDTSYPGAKTLPLPSPSYDAQHHRSGDDYFSKSRPTTATTQSSYAGEPLPKIVSPAWEEHAHAQYGPISTDESSYRPSMHKRCDSGIGRGPYWNTAAATQAVA